jgi:hypothetical protein
MEEPGLYQRSVEKFVTFFFHFKNNMNGRLLQRLTQANPGTVMKIEIEKRFLILFLKKNGRDKSKCGGADQYLQLPVRQEQESIFKKDFFQIFDCGNILVARDFLIMKKPCILRIGQEKGEVFRLQAKDEPVFFRLSGIKNIRKRYLHDGVKIYTAKVKRKSGTAKCLCSRGVGHPSRSGGERSA